MLMIVSFSGPLNKANIFLSLIEHELHSLLGALHLVDYISIHIRFDLERYLLIIHQQLLAILQGLTRFVHSFGSSCFRQAPSLSVHVVILFSGTYYLLGTVRLKGPPIILLLKSREFENETGCKIAMETIQNRQRRSNFVSLQINSLVLTFL